eukprot:g82460.t1
MSCSVLCYAMLVLVTTESEGYVMSCPVLFYYVMLVLVTTESTVKAMLCYVLPCFAIRECEGMGSACYGVDWNEHRSSSCELWLSPISLQPTHSPGGRCLVKDFPFRSQGLGTVCRAVSQGNFFREVSAESLALCELQCLDLGHACYGIEYKVDSNHCLLWLEPLHAEPTVAGAPGYMCYIKGEMSTDRPVLDVWVDLEGLEPEASAIVRLDVQLACEGSATHDPVGSLEKVLAICSGSLQRVSNLRLPQQVPVVGGNDIDLCESPTTTTTTTTSTTASPPSTTSIPPTVTPNGQNDSEDDDSEDYHNLGSNNGNNGNNRNNRNNGNSNGSKGKKGNNRDDHDDHDDEHGDYDSNDDSDDKDYADATTPRPTALPETTFVNDIQFVAAGPSTYNHTVGGGAYNDGTMRPDDDVTDMLDGYDFCCNDHVSFLTRLEMDPHEARDTKDLTLQLRYTFDQASRGGILGYTSISTAVLNYGLVVNGDNRTVNGDNRTGTNPTAFGLGYDSGNLPIEISEGGRHRLRVVKNESEGDIYQKNSQLKLWVEIDSMQPADCVVVRIDAILGCNGRGTAEKASLSARLQSVHKIDGRRAVRLGELDLPQRVALRKAQNSDICSSPPTGCGNEQPQIEPSPSSSRRSSPSSTPTASPSYSATSTSSPSSTSSISPSPTSSRSASASPSATYSPISSPSRSASSSFSPSSSPSRTASASRSNTPSESPTSSPSRTASESRSPFRSFSRSPSSSQLPIPSPTVSPSLTTSASLSPSASPSATYSPTASPSQTPSSSQTPTYSPTLSPSRTASSSSSATYSPTSSPSRTASASSSPSPSATYSPSVTASQTTTRSSATSSVSVSASQSATNSISVSASQSATSSVSVSPTYSPTTSPSRTASSSSSATYSPTSSPSLTATASPSATPSATYSPTSSSSRTPSSSRTLSNSPTSSASLSKSASQTITPSPIPFYTSVDFVGAAPRSYDHTVGGGAYNDATEGVDRDIVRDFAAEDFCHMDHVTFLTRVATNIHATYAHPLELRYLFRSNRSDVPGLAYTRLLHAGLNLGNVTNGDDGTHINPDQPYGKGLDSGNDPMFSYDETRTLEVITNETVTDTNGREDRRSALEVRVLLDGLIPGDSVVIRLDLQLECAQLRQGVLLASLRSAWRPAPNRESLNQLVPSAQRVGMRLKNDLDFCEQPHFAP